MGFARLPDARRYRLANATVPACLAEGADLVPDAEGLARADLTIDGGILAAIRPAGSPDPEGLPALDLDRGMVWPAFVEAHTHLDKGHIWPRSPNSDGSFDGALTAVRTDRAAHWSAADVQARMEFSLRCAFAHGTRLIRTHIDSDAPQHRVSWPVFAELRDAWTGRIELQGAALVGIDRLMDDAYFDDLGRTVRAHGGILGAVTYPVPGLEAGIDRLFRHAVEHGLDLDFHADETGDPAVRSLALIAEAAIRHRFRGRVLVGHCCSLARQPEDVIDRTLDLVAEAGLAVVSLPMCNMYLQDRRAGVTPRWRGVTLLHEMKARGIPVMVASDNTRDPFYAYGDLDALEVYAQATRILHLDHPVGDWPRAVTATPAEVLGWPDLGRLGAGGGADLVLLRARSWTELLSRPQADRIVVRAGRAIDTTPPDYRELDALLAPEGGNA
ncbi:cytosine deaminase [Mycobacterium sp. KBS0706]|uniref:cytosine deaminase n=1 Tax=Mycobacterium sp. KBS0706 TaxID=2578109 RepID=UPI00110FE286|nr:cytosine deaminase [Mycobacterium sp. KBS0706]TSD83459.1 cytosine deaminase [Mycobacterium sp. KBS0706]